MNKLSDVQLQKLQNLRNRIEKLTYELGSTYTKIYMVNKQLESLESEKSYLLDDYDRILQEQDIFSKEIYNEFGSGVINIENGEISNSQ